MQLSQKNPYAAQTRRPGLIYTQRRTDYSRIIQSTRRCTMSAAKDATRARDAGVGYNHYIPKLDLVAVTGTKEAVTALCGDTYTLEPATASKGVSSPHAAAELPTCPDCKTIYDAKDDGRPTACEPWCTHPDQLGDGTSEDDGCWSDETTVPAAALPDGWTVHLQSYVAGDLHDGIVLAQGDMHPITMTPAEARALAAALIDHANIWEGR